MDGLTGAGPQASRLRHKAIDAVQRWTDPREKELRKRRRLRRRTIRRNITSAVAVGADITLVAVSAPAWAIVIVGTWSGIVVITAAVSTRRYLAQRGKPLPHGTFRAQPLPPIGSAAHPLIARLVQAQRAMHDLHRTIDRTGLLPADAVQETVSDAESGAVALHAMAHQIVAMERAAAVAPVELNPMLSQLETGVTEYESMVAAAVRIVGLSGAPPQRLGDSPVRHAADRMAGFASALNDIARQPQSPRRDN